MQKKLTANIAICTHTPEGLFRVTAQNLPEIENVSYVVSWQQHHNAPIPMALANRKDITVCRCDKISLSANRNNALTHCNADIVIIGDDDVTFHPEGIKNLLDAYATHSEMELAMFRSDHNPKIRYPAHLTPLRLPLPKHYQPSSIEISFRLNALGNIQFSPLLGLNSPELHSGEDEAFLWTAITRGLNCRFVDIKVCSHSHVSTGMQKPSANYLRGSGCIIRLYYPKSYLIRIPLKAWRLSRAGKANFLFALKHLFIGSYRKREVIRSLTVIGI